MPAIKIENIIWKETTNATYLPTEAIIDITDEEYQSGLDPSKFYTVLESYADVSVASFDVKVIMEKGPFLRYRKPQVNQLVYSGPLW